jgi:hypothetical protein
MASKVGNDFKAAFALLLAVMKVNYTPSTALNYSQTVYEWTLAGLITDGKMRSGFKDEEIEGRKVKISILIATEEKYAPYVESFDYAQEQYMEAVDVISQPSVNTMKNWSQSEILRRCFVINKVLYPIALTEGYLDLKDIAAGIGAGAGGIPMARDS